MNPYRTFLALSFAALLATSALSQNLQSSHPQSVSLSAKGAPAVPPSNTPAVVARVNGVDISGAAYDEELRRVFPYFSMHGNKVPKEFEADARQKTMDNLINLELTYQEAKRRNLQITPAEWQKRIGENRREYNSQAEFEAAIKYYFGTRANFEAKLRHNMLIEKMLLIEVQRKAVVTDADVLKEFQSHKAMYTVPESVSFQTIAALFPKNATADDKKKARQRIEAIYPKAKAATDYEKFGILAENSSEDQYRVMMGERKMMHKEAIDPVFSFIFNMKEGEISQITESSVGYHIIRLNKHTMPHTLVFADVRGEMKQSMQKERLAQRTNEFYHSLRKTAKVEILKG